MDPANAHLSQLTYAIRWTGRQQTKAVQQGSSLATNELLSQQHDKLGLSWRSLPLDNVLIDLFKSHTALPATDQPVSS